MEHIFDWFLIFTLMILATVILERAATWLRRRRQNRQVPVIRFIETAPDGGESQPYENSIDGGFR